MIKHENNAHIDWYTNNIQRLTLLPDLMYPIGAFANQVKDGSMLLSPSVSNFYATGPKGPYSLLHLAGKEHATQQHSYREWMDLGVTFTGNLDHAYIGLKFRDLDYTDMVAHWSDNPGVEKSDRFRFLFTSGYNPSEASGAESKEGLEFMRLWPAKYTDPRIGIGDFFAANLVDPWSPNPPSGWTW